MERTSAAPTCPNFRTTEGAGCTSNGETYWLNYPSCQFSTDGATYLGIQAIKMTNPASGATCGSRPSPTDGQTVIRRLVSAISDPTAATATITSAAAQTTIDTASANLTNFDDATLSTLSDGGWGVETTFEGILKKRNHLKLAYRLILTDSATSTVVADRTIHGDFSIDEAVLAGTLTITGSLSAYHNLLKIIGTTQLTALTISSSCWLPVSGTIQTTFSAGANVPPTSSGTARVGKTETLTFTGCGTASLTAFDGTVTTVTVPDGYF